MWVPRLFGVMPVVAPAEFERLTRHHVAKHSLAVQDSVEKAALAVGDNVANESLKSSLRMTFIFVDSTAKISKLVEKGVVIQDTFTTISPLSNPATKVMISNALPVIKNKSLVKEQSWYGQLVSPIRMVSLVCKSPKLRHVICHRRQVMMILKDKEDHLNLSFSLMSMATTTVFASSGNMRCFGCARRDFRSALP